MASRNTCSLYGLGTLHVFSRSAMYPFPSQCLPPRSVSTGSLANSRSSLPLCAPPPTRHRLVRHLRCNGPWPNCFRRQIGRTRNYPAGRVFRRCRNGRRPWCQVPSPEEWLLARIYPHCCSKRL